MGKKSIIQVYAIIINVVAIITFIICMANLVSNLIDAMNPLMANRSAENLSSFENFKLNALKSMTRNQAYIPSEEEFRSMYEAARETKIERVMHGVKRNLVTNLVILFISVVLFWTHFRLMKKIDREQGSL